MIRRSTSDFIDHPLPNIVPTTPGPRASHHLNRRCKKQTFFKLVEGLKCLRYQLHSLRQPVTQELDKIDPRLIRAQVL